MLSAYPNDWAPLFRHLLLVVELVLLGFVKNRNTDSAVLVDCKHLGDQAYKLDG